MTTPPLPRRRSHGALLAVLPSAACDDTNTLEGAEDISYVRGRVAGRELGRSSFVAPDVCLPRDDPRLEMLAPPCLSTFEVFEGPTEEREGDEVRCVYRATWSFTPGGCSNAGRPLVADGAIVVAALRRGAWEPTALSVLSDVGMPDVNDDDLRASRRRWFRAWTSRCRSR